MKMLTEHLYGTSTYILNEGEHTKEYIIEKFNETLPHQNIAFKYKGILIETIDEGNHIKICEQHPDKDWSYTVKFDALKFKTVEDFADLVLNCSEEKVKTEYEKDEIQFLKHAIDSTSPSKKDELLLQLLSAKLK